MTFFTTFHINHWINLLVEWWDVNEQMNKFTTVYMISPSRELVSCQTIGTNNKESYIVSTNSHIYHGILHRINLFTHISRNLTLYQLIRTCIEKSTDVESRFQNFKVMQLIVLTYTTRKGGKFDSLVESCRVDNFIRLIS